jgi:hypothetical protein
MRFFRQRRKQEQGTVEATGLAEAQAARREAEERLKTTQRDLIVPLREMHRENHVQPLINALIQRRVERGNPDG